MKVKPTQPILFYDGQPLLDGDKKPVLLRDVVVNAINSVDPEDKEGMDKAKAFGISLKMFQQGEVELDLDERTFILQRAEKFLVPVAYGRLKEILEE